MSEREIAYNISLEEQLEEIKLKMWISEELQIQPKQQHSLIKKNFVKFLNQV